MAFTSKSIYRYWMSARDPRLLMKEPIEITEALRGRMRELEDASGLSAAKIITLQEETINEISRPRLKERAYRWQAGKSLYAERAEVEFILGAWEREASEVLLDKDAGVILTERTEISLTSEIVDYLRERVEATAFNASLAFRRSSDIPKGLTRIMVSQWLSGHTTRAKTEHLNYILRSIEKRR